MLILKNSFLVLVALLIWGLPLLACDNSTDGFGIFLKETGELVISDKHIKAYHANTHEIELNEEGISKWNSYMTYETIPQLVQTLYNQEFVLKVDGEEMYRGKFWSMASSAIPDSIVIEETLFKLEDNKNTIQIKYGYPIPDNSYTEDIINNPKVLRFFEKKGLLQ